MEMLSSETLQQTVCPVCKRRVPLTRDGVVGDHDPFAGGGFTTSLRCDGIGQLGQRSDKLKRAS